MNVCINFRKKNMFKAKNIKKDQRKVFIISNRRHNTQEFIMVMIQGS